HNTAGIAVVDGDGEPQRIADALFECNGVGILDVGAARLWRFALRYTLDMCERFGLTNIEALFDNALGRGERIGDADQRAGMTGRQLPERDIGLDLRRQLG